MVLVGVYFQSGGWLPGLVVTNQFLRVVRDPVVSIDAKCRIRGQFLMFFFPGETPSNRSRCVIEFSMFAKDFQPQCRSGNAVKLQWYIMAPEVSTPFLPGILTAYRAMVRYPKVHYKIQFAQDQDAATLEVNHHFQKWWFQF